MNQINVVAAVIFGAIATAFAYMFDFYPIMVALGGIGLTAYVALGPQGSASKKAPPSEPWYMK